MPRWTKSVVERFMDKVSMPNGKAGCWPWRGQRRTGGYGFFYLKGRFVSAHRTAWALLVEPVGSGACVLHRCDNPPCVNPAHLFLGTQRDNMRDASQKGRIAHGERNGQSRLTAADVMDIRRRVASGEGVTGLGREYGVSHVSVIRAARGSTWAHLPMEKHLEYR